MALVGEALGYRLLRGIAPKPRPAAPRRDYEGRSKLEACFGPGLWEQLRDRDVIDFGCGAGDDALEIARRGARLVTGLDIQEDLLAIARVRAAEAGLVDRAHFGTDAELTADFIVSLDAFEHFADPPSILRQWYDLLRPGGRVLLAFGPVWYHPRGGHLFSVFPWAHLVFSEQALLRWRADFKHDGARHFHEVKGGLNRMTIRRFERLVRHSPLHLEMFEAVPIRKLRFLASRLTREFTTSQVRAVLRRAG
jgi:SAM-dependent methyltransferase